MEKAYAAIPQPEKDTEHIVERVPGAMVKTYTYRIDLVSITEEKNEEGDQVQVPTLEAVWFTDFATFKDDKAMDRLVLNTDPTIYYGYYWDPTESTAVELKEDKFDLSGDIWVKLPEKKDGEGEETPSDAIVNGEGETLMNRNRTVRFYVPLYSRGGDIFLPETITIDQDSLEAKVGDEPVQLTYTILPVYATDKRVAWISSDESVATVSEDGVVTFVGPGTAEITAFTWNGRSATIFVTVLQPIQVPYMDTMFNVLYEDAYMALSPDGLFEPEREVTRKELITTMAHFFQDVEGIDQEALKDYIDLDRRAKDLDPVELMERYGIVEGIGHNKIALEQSATRAEVATIFCRMLGLPVGTDPNVPHAFVDTTPEKHWSWPYVDALAAAGLTDGSGYHEFRPERILTRAELAMFISRILATRVDMTVKNQVIPKDVGMEYWAFGAIIHAVNGGTMTLYGQ